MTDPYRPVPVVSEPSTRVDAGKLWAGGAATAVVAALIALSGVLIARALFDVPVLAPRGAGLWGDASTAWYAGAAAVMALLGTALMHVLLAFTPRPMRFFGWIVALVTVSAILAPFVSDASFSAELATAVLNGILGVAIGSLIAGSARSAVRATRQPWNTLDQWG